MLSLHLLAFLVLAVFLFMIIFFSCLPRADVYEGPPLSREEVLLNAMMLVDVLFWMAWLAIAVFSREYFYRENQWIRCLPVLIVAALLLVPRLLWGSMWWALVHFVSASAIYTLQASTGAWRPWALDTTQAAPDMTSFPEFF